MAAPIPPERPRSLMSDPPERRRVLVLDLMILVFALAGGLSQARPFYNEALKSWTDPRASRIWLTSEIIPLLIAATEPVVELLAVALIIVRLIPPRPSLRELACQPGLMACCNVVLGMLLGAYGSYAIQTQSLNHVIPWATPHALKFLALPTMMRGAAVAAGWFTMALTGALRMERGWVELIGIAIGLYFVALIPIWGWLLLH
jgi:hypothetical protein